MHAPAQFGHGLRIAADLGTHLLADAQAGCVVGSAVDAVAVLDRHARVALGKVLDLHTGFFGLVQLVREAGGHLAERHELGRLVDHQLGGAPLGVVEADADEIAQLAAVVGEKKAREIWYMCRRYSGAEAVAMGLANVCVPHDQLDAEVQKWGEELCERSPTALAIAKRSFNMDTAHQSGIAGMGMYALKLYYDTDESREGVKALSEKRKPEFRKFAK